MSSAPTILPIRVIHRDSLGWSTGLSVLLIVIGLLALIAPFFAGVALEAVIAWLILFGGVSHLVLAWHVRGAGAHLWEALIGLAYILAGGYLLWHPVAGLVGLTVILGVYLFCKGLFELVAGLTLRGSHGSVWLFLDAVISIILALIIWRHLTGSATWLIGTLLGFAILFTGISRLAMVLAARRHHLAIP